jgi:hypothetical protein
MIKSTRFFVTYAVNDEEWDRLKEELINHPRDSSELGRRGAPEFVPYGALQIGNDEHVLFPPQRVAERNKEIQQRLVSRGEISPHAVMDTPDDEWFPILDVSMQFDRIVNVQHFAMNKYEDTNEFVEVDGETVITFVHRRDTTTIQSNVFKDVAVIVPTTEFRAEMQRFVLDVVTDVVRHAPAALEWETLAPLRRYAQTP